MTKLALGGERVRKIANVRVRLGCDLRVSFSEKLTFAQNGLELFVNKAGTLTHLVDGKEEVLIRVKAKGGEVFDINPEYALARARKTARRLIRGA